MTRAALLLVKTSLCFHIDKKEGEDKEGLLSQLVLPVGKQALFPQSGVFSLDTKKITKEVDILLFMEDQVFFQIFVLI